MFGECFVCSLLLSASDAVGHDAGGRWWTLFEILSPFDDVAACRVALQFGDVIHVYVYLARVSAPHVKKNNTLFKI